jgi:hypothetical protein
MIGKTERAARLEAALFYFSEVRLGHKAGSANGHVRFAPNSDRKSGASVRPRSCAAPEFEYFPLQIVIGFGVMLLLLLGVMQSARKKSSGDEQIEKRT